MEVNQKVQSINFQTAARSIEGLRLFGKLFGAQAAFVLATIVVFGIPAAGAFSLAGRPTDDSVCDFSPMTTHELSARKAFVKAGTQNEAAIYARLVLRTAAQECRNGQILILDSDMGLSLDATYFPQAANRLCTVADIQRREAGTRDYPQAFELRCRITKMDSARQYINKLEAEQTTEALIMSGQRKDSAKPSPTDPLCTFGRRTGATFLCGNDSAPAAPPREEVKTDKPCTSAIIAGTGCK